MREEEVLKKATILYGSNCLQPKSTVDCINSPPMRRLRIIRAQYGRFFRQNCRSGDFALLELEHAIDENEANYICLASRIALPKIFYVIETNGWGANRSYILIHSHYVSDKFT
ncbi:unnamed protein product [Thelazia callipaeda]|uniref:SRCR domain-containing protein n=1 Tax=Thelazia callipaeda TaxID=103827 RepID=A0A0N5CTZ0_THECL|nr:unnamed protein product [Thelazia callipaeda]